MRKRTWKHSERWSMLSNPHSDIQYLIKRDTGYGQVAYPDQADVRSPCNLASPH